MNIRRTIVPVALLLVLAALVPAASAHTAFLVANKYSVKVGWLNEPPVVDQSNGITIEIRDTTQKTDDPEGKLVAGQVTNLHVSVSYAGSTKDLELDASDEEPGLYIGGIIPTSEGIYKVTVTGKIESTTIPNDGKNAISIEKVEGNDNAFPNTYGSRSDLNTQIGLLNLIAYAAIALAVIGLIFGIVGFAAARSAKRAAAAAARPPPPPPAAARMPPPAPSRAPAPPPSAPPPRRP